MLADLLGLTTVDLAQLLGTDLGPVPLAASATWDLDLFGDFDGLEMGLTLDAFLGFAPYTRATTDLLLLLGFDHFARSWDSDVLVLVLDPFAAFTLLGLAAGNLLLGGTNFALNSSGRRALLLLDVLCNTLLAIPLAEVAELLVLNTDATREDLFGHHLGLIFEEVLALALASTTCPVPAVVPDWGALLLVLPLGTMPLGDTRPFVTGTLGLNASLLDLTADILTDSAVMANVILLTFELVASASRWDFGEIEDTLSCLGILGGLLLG